MSDGVIAALIGLLAIPITLLVTWLVNRKRNISDIYRNVTDSSVGAAGAAVEAMQTAMETLSHELSTASEKIEQLSREIVELRHQNLLLLRENHSLHAKIDELVDMVGHTGEFAPISTPLPEHPASDPVS